MHSPHSSPTEKIAPNRVVLVGTFRASQLENWPGFYNYPVNEVTESIDFATVTDLWLFNDKKPAQFFHAEFLGFKTRADLIAEYGYKPKGKAHAAQYALFKTTISYTPPSYPDTTIEKVFLRLADFAASPRSKKRLKDASNTQTAAKLPEIVAKIPREKLLVCEPPLALQSDFADLETAPAFRLPVPYPAPRIGSFTFIDLFAGIGGIRLAYQELGGKCVFSSEWDPEAARRCA